MPLNGDDGTFAWGESLPVPGSSKTQRVVVPAESQSREGETLTFHGTATVAIRYGLEPVRNAYRAFSKLARELTARLPEATHMDGMLIYPLVVKDAEAERLIIAFCNRFGPLFGEDDLTHTLRDWRREAAEFLATQELGEALRAGTVARLSNRFVTRGDRLVYLTGYLEKKYLDVARQPAMITDKVSGNALPTRTDVFERTVAGGVHGKAQAALSRQLGRRLEGAASILFSPTSIGAASIAPRHLIHALYLRMWLDINEGRADERTRICKACGREIIGGTRARKFCSDECRWEFNNRRRAAQA